MIERCDAPSCSQEMNHDGPHGGRVGNIVVAPYSDLPRKRAANALDPTIACNACGAPLRLHDERTRAECTSCDQRIAFSERGYTQTVLPKLYPVKMTDPEMMREFAEHQVSEWAFFDSLQLQFGLIDETESAVRRARTEEAKAKFIADEVLPLEQKRRWWQFWRRG